MSSDKLDAFAGRIASPLRLFPDANCIESMIGAKYTEQTPPRKHTALAFGKADALGGTYLLVH